MKTCCFCFDLKHGSNASATFTLVTRIIGVIIFTVALVRVHQNYEERVIEFHEKNEEINYSSNGGSRPSIPSSDDLLFPDILFGVAIGLCALVATFSVMLLIGIKKNIKCLFWPWIIMTGMEIGGAIFLLVKYLTVLTYPGVVYNAIGALIGAIFNSYMFWCVVAHYKSLAVTEMPYQHFATQNKEMSSENLAAPYKMEKDTTRLV